MSQDAPQTLRDYFRRHPGHLFQHDVYIFTGESAADGRTTRYTAAALDAPCTVVKERRRHALIEYCVVAGEPVYIYHQKSGRTTLFDVVGQKETWWHSDLIQFVIERDF